MTRTAIKMFHTISFGFRATGKYNICLYRYVGIAYIVLDISSLESKERQW